MAGGLDATNVVARPRLCAITPVDLDHQQYLGDTLAQIAAEKGRDPPPPPLKRGVPCVVAPQHDAALDAIEAQAARVGAPLIVAGQHWHGTEEHGRLVFQDETGLLDLPLPSLPGPHPVINAGTALAALRALGLDEAACAAALTRADWPARMQRLRSGRWAERAPRPSCGLTAAQSRRRPGRRRDAGADAGPAHASGLRDAVDQGYRRLHWRRWRASPKA